MLICARLLMVSLLAVLMISPSLAALPTAVVRGDRAAPLRQAEGVVEALRASTVAAQVSGIVTELRVKPGEVVKVGQVLARLDARAAKQGAAASSAQADAARASLEVAQKEYARQQQLFARQYISQAALDRAEAQFKAARAQVNAQLASAGVAVTQAGFYVLTAPYDGVVAEVPVNPGEMALPGRTIVTLYDPKALRVTASLPQAALAGLAQGVPVRIELPSLPANLRWHTASEVTVLPTADQSTQTVQIRLALPLGVKASPGMFARAWLPQQLDGGEGRLYVPSEAVFRRGEMQLVYVLSPQGKLLLRQIKAGPRGERETEVLSGVRLGETVVLDPIAAAKVH